MANAYIRTLGPTILRRLAKKMWATNLKWWECEVIPCSQKNDWLIEQLSPWHGMACTEKPCCISLNECSTASISELCLYFLFIAEGLSQGMLDARLHQ